MATTEPPKKLSIIIPVYNAEKYISACLDSILAQPISPTLYEIILVNDGSTDKSPEIAKYYASNHENIRCFDQPNGGQSSARNRGIKEAHGKYLWFVDADDVIVPNSLAYLSRFINSDNVYDEVDIITFQIVFGKSEDLNLSNADSHTIKIDAPVSGYEFISRHNYNNSPCLYFVNASFLRLINLKFADGKLCEDGVFTATMFLSAKTVIATNINTYCYILRPQSTVTTKDHDRRKKLNDGFRFAISALTDLIDKHTPYMGKECLRRIQCRRDSYIFFLLIRLFKDADYTSAKRQLKELKKNNLYPIRHFIGVDYNGYKMRGILTLMNIGPLYLSLVATNKLIRKLR